MCEPQLNESSALAAPEASKHVTNMMVENFMHPSSVDEAVYCIFGVAEDLMAHAGRRSLSRAEKLHVPDYAFQSLRTNPLERQIGLIMVIVTLVRPERLVLSFAGTWVQMGP